MSKKQSLDDFPVVLDLPVLWGDMDALQHVNNVRFFRYLESARIEYMERAGLFALLRENGIGPILAETNCKFISPLTYPDTIAVGCRTVSMTESELTQEYLIVSRGQERATALGQARIVAYDFKALSRSSFPEPLFERIRSLDPQLAGKNQQAESS
jgi:acyl-CoA thioester hydrolase